MGRFDIIVGKYKDNPVSNGRDHPPTRKLIRIQEWKKILRSRSGPLDLKVTLEISPKKSTCKKCRNTIEPGCKRYVLWDKYYKKFYHEKCLPSGFSKIIESEPTKVFNGDTLNYLKHLIAENLNNLQYTRDRNDIRKSLITWLKGFIYD